MANSYSIVHGKRVCSCMVRTIPIVEKGLRNLGVVKKDLSGLIIQGSYNKGVGASKGSHDLGGVLDVAHNLVDTDAKRLVWFSAGYIPFDRRTVDFPVSKAKNHGHVVQVGCPHRTSILVNQETSARKGRNALANNGPFRGKIPFIRSWADALKLSSPAKPSDTRPPFSLANVLLARRTGQVDGNVTIVQNELNKHNCAHGAGVLKVDGIWGSVTQKAFDAYRRKVIKYRNEKDNTGAPGKASMQHLLSTFRIV